MSAYFTSLVIILFTNILAIPWIYSVPCACNFLPSAPRCSQARVCGFPCFVMGRDQIYPPPGFALLHSPLQNADQTGRGNEGGVFAQMRFTAACGALGPGFNGPDRWAAVPRPPGMHLSFLSLSQGSRIYWIWSGRTGIRAVLLQQVVLKELPGRCSRALGEMAAEKNRRRKD